ncbi:MAG: choice-of-anchor tandem repeat GloVer-containing protein [Verrucomicrobiia bacterium]
MRISQVLLAIILVTWLGQPGRATADTIKTLHTFTGGSGGSQPYGGLIQGSDGNFYGTTYSGGGSDSGTVFSITAAGTLSTIYNFGGGSDGANPEAGLIQGSDGFLYGTTSRGGTGKAGTVFKVGTTGTLTTLHYFTGGSDGGNPQAGIVQGSDGNYYGTTYSGGTSSTGTIFAISSGDFITSYDFTGGANGGNPKAGLVEGSDGFLYGTTYSGGVSNAGTVFRYSLGSGLIPLYNFTGGEDGANPQGALVEGSDSNFYGTTFGGANGFGTVFRIRTAGNLTVLWIFGDGSDGGNPEGGLILGQDGNFYGTTSTGGNGGFGTVFKITKGGALTTLYNFTGGNDGATPLAGLLQASATNFLGTTSAAGSDSLGTVFSLIQPCTFSLSPSRVTLTAIAPGGTFAVTSSGTGCVWTATSNVDWISVTSSNSGIGDGTVAYSMTINTNSKSRVGTITVDGKNFTVTQQGEALGSFIPGSYDGLVMVTNAPAQASSGLITLVLGNTGSFAADLTVDGVRSAFKGQFDSKGNSTTTITNRNSNPLTVILEAAAVSNATDEIVGTVSNGTFTAQLVANLAVFSAANPSPWVGAFTLVLAPADSSETNAPQGYGYGTLTVTSLGSGSLKGVLGDGTKISGKFPVSGYGTWPLYNSLYKNNGACIGWVTFNEDNTLGGTVYWFKEPGSAGPFYSGGFSTALSLSGDIYVGGSSVAATGQLTLGGGNLASNIVIGVSIDARGTGTASPVGSNDLKLKVAPATGALSGSFLDPTINKAVKFNGLLLQSSGAASGYFLGTNESGFVTFVPDTE